MTWKNRANASTFIFSSPVKLPLTPTGEGQSARWRAFVIPRPIMSIVTNVARPVPARAKVHRRSGRLRQAKPRTAEASAVMTKIVSGRKTVYSDRSEPSEDSLGPRRDHVEDQDRQDAEHGEGDRQDREGRDLEAAEVRHRLPFRIRRPENRPLQRPDVVRRGEDHREDGHEDEEAEGRIHADEDAEGRHEPDETGEAEGGQEGHHHERGHTRRPFRDPAEFRDVPRPNHVAERSGDHEEGRGHEAVGEHLEDRAREAEDRAAAVPAARGEAVQPGSDPEGHERHVAHTGECDEALQVVLDDADEGPVQDRDDPDEREEPVQVARRGREHLHVEPDESVTAELEQDARQDHRPAGRRLHVRVRQPCVERPRRQLRAEGDEERDEREVGEQPGWDRQSRDDRGHVERVRARVQVEGEDDDQEGKGRKERVQEELERRVAPPRTAPDRDQEVHRDEADLPEDEELEQVQGQEHAADRRLHEEEHGEELGNPRMLVPGDRQGEGREEGVQEDEDDGQLVRAEEVVHVQSRNPERLFDRIVGVRSGHHHFRERNRVRPEEARQEDRREREVEEGETERDPPCGACRPGDVGKEVSEMFVDYAILTWIVFLPALAALLSYVAVLPRAVLPISPGLSLLTPLALAISWDEHSRVPEFFAMFLFMETTISGVFLSLDLFQFLVFWEVGLVPMYFLIAVWGGPRRSYAAFKFFLYTFLASLPLLVVIFAFYLYSSPHTFDMTVIISTLPIPPGALADLAFVGLLIAFGTKLPTWPLHTWLPYAHVEAPTGGSVVLPGLLTELGGFGLVRAHVQHAPTAAGDLYWLLALVGIISILYGAFVCIVQDDLKRLVAFSSVSHMGFVTLGIAAGVYGFSAGGGYGRGAVLRFSGAIFQMFAHGLVSAALFMVAGSLGHMIGTRKISELGGIAKRAPRVATFMMISFLASLGLPGLVGFVAEFSVFVGVYAAFGLLVFVPVLTVILTAAYFIWAMQTAIFGPPNPPWEAMPDLHRFQVAPLAVLTVAFAVFGILPILIFNVISAWSQGILGGL